MNTRELLLYQSLRGLHSLEKAPKAEVVRDLCGLQAQFSRNPMLSLWLRASDFSPEAWGEGLIKIWSQRGTTHVIAEDELGLYLSAQDSCGPYGDGWWGLTRAEMERWTPFLRDQVAAGNDTRDGLKRACLDAGMGESTLSKVFYGWGGLIKEMCLRGLIACRTGTDKRYLIPKPPVLQDRDDARKALVRRYFRHYGPATAADCRAFFGWKQKEMKPLFDAILPELRATTVDKAVYYHAEPLEEGELPPCVLIPGFDALVMGYKERGRFLDAANARKLTNMAGIVFPAAIVRGRVRARWKLENGAAHVTPFERLYKKDEAAIRRALRAAFGKAAGTPVFHEAE